jgi:hypothetical protein
MQRSDYQICNETYMKTQYFGSVMVTLLMVSALLVAGQASAQTSTTTTTTATSTTSGGGGSTGVSTGSSGSFISPEMLYNQSGVRIEGYNGTTKALNPGWYYTQTGSPRYYYANGVYYDPATQSYGGSVLYPSASGPQSMGGSSVSGSGTLTPGVPNTGVGPAVYAWLGLILSAVIAVFGANYLTRKSS